MERSTEDEMLKRLNLILPDLKAGVPPTEILRKRNLDWSTSYIPFLKKKARALGYSIPRSNGRELYESQKKKTTKPTKTKTTKNNQQKHQVVKEEPLPQIPDTEVVVIINGIKFHIPANTKNVRVLPNGTIEIW